MWLQSMSSFANCVYAAVEEGEWLWGMPAVEEQRRSSGGALRMESLCFFCWPAKHLQLLLLLTHRKNSASSHGFTWYLKRSFSHFYVMMMMLMMMFMVMMMMMICSRSRSLLTDQNLIKSISIRWASLDHLLVRWKMSLISWRWLSSLEDDFHQITSHVQSVLRWSLWCPQDIYSTKSSVLLPKKFSTLVKDFHSRWAATHRFCASRCLIQMPVDYLIL